MSTVFTQNTQNIPYEKYFEFCFYENWSLYNYVSLIISNYKYADKKEAHHTFYHIIYNINNDLSIS